MGRDERPEVVVVVVVSGENDGVRCELGVGACPALVRVVLRPAAPVETSALVTYVSWSKSNPWSRYGKLGLVKA